MPINKNKTFLDISMFLFAAAQVIPIKTLAAGCIHISLKRFKTIFLIIEQRE
jgi:hypothetical protein